MNSSEKWASVAGGKSFLVILFGSLEYDGRVKRMLEVLRELGPVTLVDLESDRKKSKDRFEGVDKIRVALPPNAGKFYRHLRFWLTSVRQAWRVKPGVIVAEDYFTCFPGWLAAKFAGAKFAYDAHELIIPEVGKKMILRSRFWYLLERWAVQRANLVIAANEDRAQFMADHYGLKRLPEVMRNIPPGGYLPTDPKKAIQAYPALARRNHEERFLLYQGDVNLSRGLGRFVKALEFLPQCYRLVVAGSGPDLDKLCAMAEPFSREGRFVALGKVENQMLPAITTLADVGIVSYPFTGLNNIYCAPNKLFEYAQAGLPVVATDQPPLRKAVETYEIGELVCEKDFPEQVASTLRKVVTNKNRYQKQLPGFLDANKWQDEAERVRKSFESIWTGMS